MRLPLLRVLSPTFPLFISFSYPRYCGANSIEFPLSTPAEVAKFYLVKWVLAYRLFSHGGLAINNVWCSNEALMGKWLIWFGVERNAFWRQVIMVKYNMLPSGLFSKVPSELHGVDLWKSIYGPCFPYLWCLMWEMSFLSVFGMMSGEPLKFIYPELYHISCIPNAPMVDFIHF